MQPSQPNQSRQEQLVVAQPSTPGVTQNRRQLLVRIAAGGVGALVVAAGAWALLGDGDDPVGPGLVFVIPKGAADGVAGSTLISAIDIPTQITFAKGETAAITIRNEDSVTLRAGPFLVGPGQTYVQRFPSPGEYPIACTVDPAESIVVTVEG